jgi:hypothetical protein
MFKAAPVKEVGILVYIIVTGVISLLLFSTSSTSCCIRSDRQPRGACEGAAQVQRQPSSI